MNVSKKQRVEMDVFGDFRLDHDGTLHFQGRICVPNNPELKRAILEEAHSSRFAMHPGGNKMYRDLRGSYWWSGM